MKHLELIHLDREQILPVVNELKLLLADYQLYYSNLRGLHWNIKGKRFFMLHEQFEKMYNEATERVDEIAERILTLGFDAEHKYSHYLKVSRLKESEKIENEEEAIQLILDTESHLVKVERELIELASEASDETTVALLSDYLAGHEKRLWMLLAYQG